jgi:hypothetical protein
MNKPEWTITLFPPPPGSDRTLIYVPIVHSEADLGSLAEEIRRQLSDAFGADSLQQAARSVEAMWASLHSHFAAFPFAWDKVKLYQDGLAVCGMEEQIVHDLAGQKSTNHQVLVELMKRGAKLMGTEDPKLLVRDYHRIQKLVQAARDRAPDSVVEPLKREGELLLQERDLYIAQRIDSTLEEGETGILCIGLLHHVTEHLEGKMGVRWAKHHLPISENAWRKLKGERHGN